MAKKEEKLREGKVVDVPEEESNVDVYIPDDSFMLPNEGQAFHDEQAEEIKEEINQDQTMFAGNDTLVAAVFEWMDNEIADCDSVKAAIAIAAAYNVTIEQAMISLELCGKVFQAKRVSFQDIYDTINKTETNS